MNLDLLRAYCLSLPHAAEKIQWENDLLFTIGEKIFAVTPLEPAPFVLTFKPDAEHRLELLEIDGVEPAPYLARAGWLSVRRWDVFRDSEWRELVTESYRMVLQKLPKKLQATISGSEAPQRAGANPAGKRTSKSRGGLTVSGKHTSKSKGAQTVSAKSAKRPTKRRSR
jgi:predicted DNA-binding protein (MmcQ/YjbR family)